MTTELKVPDATCGHCKSTIEGAVSALRGVQAAELDLASKVLRVTHDDSSAPDDVAQAVAEAGYSPEAVA